MPGEKGDVGNMVGDLMPSSSSNTMSTVRFDGLTCLSPFNRAALETLVLLVTVG